MPTGFSPRNDQDIDTHFGLLNGVLLRPDERADWHAMAFTQFEHVSRGYPKRVDDHSNRVRKGNVEYICGARFA